MAPKAKSEASVSNRSLSPVSKMANTGGVMHASFSVWNAFSCSSFQSNVSSFLVSLVKGMAIFE